MECRRTADVVVLLCAQAGRDVTRLKNGDRSGTNSEHLTNSIIRNGDSGRCTLVKSRDVLVSSCVVEGMHQ